MATSTHTGSPQTTGQDADDHHVSPSDIAVGVIIGRTSEFFDFFVFSIACVLVFPARLFGFLTRSRGRWPLSCCWHWPSWRGLSAR